MLRLLPDDASHVVVALLERDDLESLRGVCRETARDPLLLDPRPRTLILPPVDTECARLLLAGLSSSHNLAAVFSSIQVATVWHVDLLLEYSLCDHVESVRVSPNDDADGETARAICGKLQRLPSLVRLDLTDSSLQAVDTIAEITQLRELDLTNTSVSNIDSLSSLTHLQKLVLDETSVSNLEFIRNMLKLRELRALDQRAGGTNRAAPWANRYVEVYVPPLHAHRKLQRLELDFCTVESTANLFSIAGGLQALKLANIRVRYRNTIIDDATGFPVNADEPELLARLTQLETIHLDNSVSVLGVTDEGAVASLARIPSLRVIEHPIKSNLEGLAPLIRLEELELHLCTTYMDHGRVLEDFTVLLKLPVLTKLKIRHNAHVSYPMPVYIPSHEYENIKREARAFTDVLEQLTGLESLAYEGYIDSADVLPLLTGLKNLSLSRITPQITSFDWIPALHGLRSLTISTDSRKCDHSAIGYLTQLEELSIRDLQRHCEDHSSFAFVGTLVNLRKLELQGEHIHDLACLSHLKRLTTLTVKSVCKSVGTSNTASLTGLEMLRGLDISDLAIEDFTPLLSMRSLRSISIPATADCSPLVVCAPPKLLYLLHRGHNCLWSAPHSTVVDQRQSTFTAYAPSSDSRNSRATRR